MLNWHLFSPSLCLLVTKPKTAFSQIYLALPFYDSRDRTRGMSCSKGRTVAPFMPVSDSYEMYIFMWSVRWTEGETSAPSSPLFLNPDQTLSFLSSLFLIFSSLLYFVHFPLLCCSVSFHFSDFSFSFFALWNMMEIKSVNGEKTTLCSNESYTNWRKINYLSTADIVIFQHHGKHFLYLSHIRACNLNNILYQ